MPTAKNQIFIGLEDDSCYLVRGIFPGGKGGEEGRKEGMIKFLAGGGGLPPTPVGKTLG